MIFDSLDAIPLKLYLKIEATGDVSLLTDNKEQLKYCSEIWTQLNKDYNSLGLNPGAQKVLDLSVRIETLKAKYNFIITATNCLNFEQDEELEKQLRAFGYSLNRKTYKIDLERIKRESSNIMLKVNRIEKQLNKDSENGKTEDKKATIDKIILGYCSVTGVQYNTNEITVTQFDALKSLFDDKLKAVEKDKPKK